jgi:putative chitinase
MMIAALLRKIRARGNASTPEQRQAEIMREVDAALAPEPPAPAPAHPVAVVAQPKRKTATLDRAAFFAHLRGGPLHHRSGDQVRGTEAILDAMAGEPISWVAYALATSWHETGDKMLPNVESLNYSVSGLLNTFGRHRISRADAERLGRKPGEPALSQSRQRQIANILYGGTWGRDNLGNTEPDDGWNYRGRGLSHVTGRANYGRSGRALGIDLLGNPAAMLDLDTAVRELTSGMKVGRYRPGNSFAIHLPTVGDASATQFGRARDIINGGRDRAADIAALALRFQGALRVAGWQ